MPDLVIRGAQIVDGTGGEAYAVDGDRISEIGSVSSRGTRKIEADGLVVSAGIGGLAT